MNLPWQPFFLALANRARGGLVKINSGQLSRLVCWALPLAATIWTAKHPDDFYKSCLYFAFLTVGAWLSSTFPKWGKFWDLGRNPKNPGSALYKIAMMTLQGVLFVSLPALVTFAASPKLSLCVMAGGLCIAPAYELGWRTHTGEKDFEAGPPMGEVYEGGFIGLMIWCAVFYNFL